MKIVVLETALEQTGGELFMTWNDFYENYMEWAESTVSSRISSLKEMGPTDEIIEVATEFSDPLSSRIIRKAVSLGKVFTPQNVVDLYGAVPDALLEELITRYMDTGKPIKYDSIIDLDGILSQKMMERIVRYDVDNGVVFTPEQIIEMDGIVSSGVLTYALKKWNKPLTASQLEYLDGVVDIDQLSRKLTKQATADLQEEYDYNDSYDYADTSGKKPGLLDKLGVFFMVDGAEKYAKKRRERKQSERDSSYHLFGNTPAKYHIGDYVRVRSRRKSGTIVDMTNKRYDIRLDDGTYLRAVSETDIERSLF